MPYHSEVLLVPLWDTSRTTARYSRQPCGNCNLQWYEMYPTVVQEVPRYGTAVSYTHLLIDVYPMNDPHILGTERIGKLLVQYSIPAIIGKMCIRDR